MCVSIFFASEPAGGMRWRRSFPGQARYAAAARRFVAALLDDCPFLDEVTLAADELVVNALRHTRSGGPGGTFAVDVGRWDALVAVAVSDQGGPNEPAVVDAHELAECGRGLRTISAMAAGWGWFGNEQARTVTAVFASSGVSWVAAA
ncbi:ATP-binding protein [Actinomadura sp. NPDC047616]|uniref:ATP-binding protein n=1 Tax=Actinomadura sp. NPDC047616 TaxID=3155914 RepID=UPI00340C33F1